MPKPDSKPLQPILVQLYLSYFFTLAERLPDAEKRRHPLCHLIEQALTAPTVYQDLVDRIAAGTRVEYPLNGAGLKLFTHQGSWRIGGDQAKDYPEFVARVHRYLAKEGRLPVALVGTAPCVTESPASSEGYAVRG